MATSSSSSFCCEICLEHLPISQKLPFTVHQCSCPDIFVCISCTASYIRVSVKAGRTLISCPLCLLDCTKPLDPVTCQELVSNEVFTQWCHIACEGNLLGYGRCYCPNGDCQELIIDECGGSEAPRRIVCPSCKTGCCFRCSLPWEEQERHKCDRVLSIIERKKWKPCPGCKNYVERIEGCSTVFCRETALTSLSFPVGMTKFRKLGRPTGHRMSMLRTMVSQLVKHERIETTVAKAKEVRRLADNMVQLGKEGSLSAARHAAAFVRGDDVLHKLFTELAYRYKDRAGGYTRLLRTRIRVGDAAPMAYIE
ncbi:hypothetical protein CDL15_Pgr010835 [Punica granatum]|uniref:RING-type domain-containing protein n=1 Tax=Punica granatum TaxID=22663 RepID=A0A218W4W6_PUNGR|nr:hypothetical protein CDL15_Pgr010835 [Punica granatum]